MTRSTRTALSASASVVFLFSFALYFEFFSRSLNKFIRFPFSLHDSFVTFIMMYESLVKFNYNLFSFHMFKKIHKESFLLFEY